jgi:hypothetical protein
MQRFLEFSVHWFVLVLELQTEQVIP